MPAYPPALEDTIRAELRGEEILWCAPPGRQSYWRSQRGTLVGGVFLLLFATFWLWGVMHAGKNGDRTSWLFVAFGCFFLAGVIGQFLSVLVLLFGSRIFYVITRQRAIIFKKLWRVEVRSYEVAALANFERISFGGRAGDLIFQRIGSGSGKRSSVTEIGFFGLESFAEPEALLRDLAKQPMKPATLQ